MGQSAVKAVKVSSKEVSANSWVMPAEGPKTAQSLSPTEIDVSIVDCRNVLRLE